MSTTTAFDNIKTDSSRLRKLPKSWRKANFIYQIILIILTFANVLLTVVNSNDPDLIPTMYFELYSVGISSLPVVWSKILDEAKIYYGTVSPSASLAAIEEQGKSESPMEEHHTLGRSKSLTSLETLIADPEFLKTLKKYNIEPLEDIPE